MMTDVMEHADVRMSERADRARFTIETRAEIRIGSEMRWKDFNGNRAVETRITRPVHFSHSAGAQRRDDLIGPEARSCGKAHCERGF